MMIEAIPAFIWKARVSEILRQPAKEVGLSGGGISYGSKINRQRRSGLQFISRPGERTLPDSDSRAPVADGPQGLDWARSPHLFSVAPLPKNDCIVLGRIGVRPFTAVPVAGLEPALHFRENGF